MLGIKKLFDGTEFHSVENGVVPTGTAKHIAADAARAVDSRRVSKKKEDEC